MTLHGAVTNTGSINLANIISFTHLVVGAEGLTLTGGGTVSLSENKDNLILGEAGDTLTNVDNTISGAGFIGDLNQVGTFTLVNQAAGVIDAKGPVHLIIDTGANIITNAGVIEATGRGGGLILSAVDNTGTLKAAGGNLTVDGAVTGAGSATINGATLAFGSSFTENVTFTGTTGVLELAQSQSYAGKVRGFSLTGGTSLDLDDIGFVSAGEATFSGNATSGVLTVTDGAHTAHITLIGDYTGATFVAGSDGHGGVSIVDTHAGVGASIAPPARHVHRGQPPVHRRHGRLRRERGRRPRDRRAVAPRRAAQPDRAQNARRLILARLDQVPPGLARVAASPPGARCKLIATVRRLPRRHRPKHLVLHDEAMKQRRQDVKPDETK